MWTGRVGTWTSSSPAVANGVVYIGSNDNNLYAFAAGCRSDGGSCTPLWTWRGDQVIVSSPAVSNGVVYAGVGDNVYAFDLLHGDVTPPVITSGPLMGSVVPSTLGQRTTLITWLANDGDGTGIIRYDVEHQRDGGAWIHISSTTASHITRSLKLGHAYRYRVRAYDLAGNVGAWATSGATVPALVQGSSSRVKYPVGAWHTQVTAKASGGSSQFSRSVPARATFTFTGRAIAWVTSMGPTRGRVDVYVDGAYVTQVDLHLNYTKWQRLLFSASWANRGTHTISLRNSPAGGRFDVDTFVVYK
jgi:hypothetical protein